jgi:uncharacterized protein (TIGR03086 family)
VVAAIGGRVDPILVAQSLAGFTAPLVCARVPVALLVLVAAMVPRPGESAGAWWANTGHVFPDPFDPMTVFARDLAPDVASVSVAHVRDQSGTPFEQPWPLDAWPEVPTRFLLCRDDRFFPAEFQRRIVQERLGMVPDKMSGGHLPALGHPDELVQSLETYRVELKEGRMSKHVCDVSDRWRRVSDGFTRRARAVAPDGWERPAPCDGWVTRDVVRHLVEWMPAFLVAAGGPALAGGPSVDDDPAGAWTAMSDAIQELLDDPTAVSATITHPRAGTHTLGDAIGTFFLGDVLIHTWDLARATGLDETIDAEEVSRMLAGLEPIDDLLRASGQYGPRVDVPATADEQTRLIAFTGRRP